MLNVVVVISVTSSVIQLLDMLLLLLLGADTSVVDGIAVAGEEDQNSQSYDADHATL